MPYYHKHLLWMIDVDASIQLVDYIRFELGDGIEKKEDNFVEEVMAQAKGS